MQVDQPPTTLVMLTSYVTFFGPACALIVAGIWIEAKRRGFRSDALAAAIAGCAAGAVIGSKVLMFDFHAAVYGEKTFLGAVVGGAAALVVIMRCMRWNAQVFDIPVLPVLWGAALGRVGCFVAGCCHGVPTAVPWAVRYGRGTSVFRE